MITAMPKITRQQFIHTGLAIAAMPLSLSGCTPAESHGSYEEAIKQTWRISKDQFENEQLLQRELVRCATLAPSGHNTQPWKFHIERGSISMLPDFNRRTSIVDPDDHHLFVSLGCALENMVQASKAYGLQSVAQFDAAKDVVTVRLEPTKALASPLFHAIANRQCTRGIYNGLPLTAFEDRKSVV